MRYFVTGATGFIGGEVAKQLGAAGHKVVALVRDPSKAGNVAALGAALHWAISLIKRACVAR